MNIVKKQDGSRLTLALEDRLDMTTAPELEKEVSTSLPGVTELVFDLKTLEYISSAGLRVLPSAQKMMNKQGSMVIRNVNENIMEVFDFTGVIDILTIE